MPCSFAGAGEASTTAHTAKHAASFRTVTLDLDILGQENSKRRKKLTYALKRGEVVQYSCGTSEIVPAHSIANG